MRAKFLAALLGALALAQAGVLTHRLSARAASAPRAGGLETGDRVPRVTGVDLTGRPATLDLARGDSFTVVLAYDANCAHSSKVARQWKAWLALPHPARVAALAKDPPDSAAAFRASSGWEVDVIAVHRPIEGSPERRLLRRTPWVFVFDSYGVLRLEAHGAELAAVDSLIKTSPRSPI